MVSRRYRANRSVGNKLLNLQDKVIQQQKTGKTNSIASQAITDANIADGTIQGVSLGDRAVTSEKIARAAITTSNLGIINTVNSDASMVLRMGGSGHLALEGDAYESPYESLTDADGLYTVAFDPADNALKVIEATPPAPDGLRFDTTYTGGSLAPGMLSWSSEFETLEFLSDEHVSIQIGQESVYRVKNASASVAIPKFRLVMFAGATGDTVTVSPATATGIRENPAYLVGITAEEIAADGFGFVTHFGFLSNVNTDSFTLGDLLYLDPATTTGVLTATKPSAPFFDAPIAAVTRVQTNSGRVLVRMEFGSKVADLHDVQVTSVANGDSLQYNSTNSRWENVPGLPAGIVQMFAGTGATSSTGSTSGYGTNGMGVNATSTVYPWLLCNGDAVSRTVYASLFSAIGTSYGVGDNSTTFNLPSMNARFPRGAATAGTGFGSDTHNHALSDNGYAKVRRANNRIVLDETSTDSWTADQEVTGTGSTSSQGSAAGAGLGGYTESTSNVPLYTSFRFIIKT